MIYVRGTWIITGTVAAIIIGFGILQEPMNFKIIIVGLLLSYLSLLMRIRILEKQTDKESDKVVI